MEVRQSEWKKTAIENISKYLHRGGELQGDVPQLIGGADLLNTIGVAMGLPMCNPDNWTKHQLEKALKGELVYFENDARKAIDVIADQIRHCCGGDNVNYVTVLPIELYFNGKLYELPVFRVKRNVKTKNYYIDNVGRSYDSPSDWYDNNKLPPGEMAYPSSLKLSVGSNGKDALVTFADTPCSRLDSQTARGLDIAAGVLGLGSSVALLFVTGGLATPLVVTGLGAAGWGTTRAGYQLVDKATHGENVNPFTSSESRMLWLGIAANLTSFGAMGATMRLTSLAARGREISTALRVLADVANGTNIAVSGFAILNTTIFMINNYKDLSAMDVLMHGASVAFWTKGLFCYKTATVIIRDAENYAFATLTKGLSQEEASQFAEVRNSVQNDAQLLQKFQAAMKANISGKDYSRLLIDGMQYYDTVSNLSPEQINAFDGLRMYMRDDVKLISGLRRVSTNYNLNRAETIEMVLNMWQHMSSTNTNDGGSITLSGGNLVLGKAPPIKINQLPNLSAPMIKFFGEHLSQADSHTSKQWSTSVPVLLQLQSHGMFTICPVTKVVIAGRAVVNLNGHLEISIHRLNALPVDECVSVFRMLGSLKSGVKSSNLPPDLVKLCVHKLRLRFECHRNESVAQTSQLVKKHPALLKVVESNLKGHEKDRLYTFLNDVEKSKGNLYMKEMMAWVAEKNPTNISEFVAYSEFIMALVENEALSIKQKLISGEMKLPSGATKTVWTRNEAMKTIFKNTSQITKKFAEVFKLVQDNRMVGTLEVGKDLSTSQLVAAVSNKRVAFGSSISATYHVVKHTISPLSEYVNRANVTVRNPSANWTVTTGQLGDVRNITVEDANGKCFLLERDGGVILCSYLPK